MTEALDADLHDGDLARGLATATGQPLSTTYRELQKLEGRKLAEKSPKGRWGLTSKGMKEAAKC